MTAILKTWLYAESVKNIKNRSTIRKARFLLNALFLRCLANFFYAGKMILSSAALEAERQSDWERLRSDSRHDMYEPIFSILHFTKDEVWQIKDQLYRVESVKNTFEISLVNIETYEVVALEQLMPLKVEEVKYRRNLSYELTKLNIYSKGNFQVMTYEQFALI